ncbi:MULTISPECIES: PspC domain-containing protein [Gordonia]|nr:MULTISPECIES: PspC domain-containing protein [Gordonia]
MDTKQLEQMWTSRPVRTTARTVAGVCSGIGARYRVDPTLVKVAFVVATLFGGSGILLYAIAWLTFPGTSGRAKIGGPREHRSALHGHGRHQLILVVVIVLGIHTVFGFGSQTWGSGGLMGTILMLAGWWLLYRRTPAAPPGTGADNYRAPAASAAHSFQRWTPRDMTDGLVPSGYAGAAAGHPAAPTGYGPSASAPPDTARTPWSPAGVQSVPAQPTGAAASTDTGVVPPVPPAWDPLGAAPFAWDLPEPASSGDDSPDPGRSPWTPMVLGVAILTAAGAGAAHLAGVDWFTPLRIAALALAVIGAGLVGSALRRRPAGGHATGLATVAVILGAGLLLAAAADMQWQRLPGGGVGERVWTPQSEHDIRPEYSFTMGSGTLDLTGVTLTEDRSVSIRGGIGEIDITVPSDMAIDVTCSANVGDTHCPDGLSKGDSRPGGPVLSIDAAVNLGDVEVAR